MRISTPKPPSAKINVTPMIDVVMCLIVFFLIVGQLASDRLARVDLPTTTVGVEPESSETLIINALSDGGAVRLVIDGRDTTMDGLVAYLRQHAASGAEIRLRADRSIPYGRLRPLIDACRDAGVRTLTLATEVGS